jgi:hypothetical protein
MSAITLATRLCAGGVFLDVVSILVRRPKTTLIFKFDRAMLCQRAHDTTPLGAPRSSGNEIPVSNITQRSSPHEP